MDPELQSIEDKLKALKPRPLDPALLEYLSVSMGDEATAAEDSVSAIESRLRRTKPSRPSAALMEKLAGQLDRVPFQPEVKTVPFPVAPASQPSPNRFSWMAAAAAVALAGAWMAVKMSPEPAASKQVAVAQPIETFAAPTDSGNFQPATFDRVIENTDDLGVKWNRQAKPMRVVRVTYVDRMKFHNAKGEEVEMD